MYRKAMSMHSAAGDGCNYRKCDDGQAIWKERGRTRPEVLAATLPWEKFFNSQTKDNLNNRVGEGLSGCDRIPIRTLVLPRLHEEEIGNSLNNKFLILWG